LILKKKSKHSVIESEKKTKSRSSTMMIDEFGEPFQRKMAKDIKNLPIVLDESKKTRTDRFPNLKFKST
jgi:hypothetical protein